MIEFLLKNYSFIHLYFFSPTKCESVGGQECPKKYHKNCIVFFFIAREKIELAKRIHDKKLKSSHTNNHDVHGVHMTIITIVTLVTMMTLATIMTMTTMMTILTMIRIAASMSLS